MMTTLEQMQTRHNFLLAKFWDSVETGYFVPDPVNGGRRTKVHLVYRGFPVCGSVMSDGAGYDYCAGRVHIPYVECEHCKRIYAKAKNNS